MSEENGDTRSRKEIRLTPFFNIHARLHSFTSEERRTKGAHLCLAKNGRVFGEEKGPPHQGAPDGIKVDKQGQIFVTGPKGIWVWDPDGHHLGTIEMPEQPANLTWGDKDYQKLYITATTSVYRLRTKTRGFVPHLEH